jgi:acetyl esterase/lipase
LTVIWSLARVAPGRCAGVLATSRVARALAWVALACATGWLVRGEILRPELPEGVTVTTDLVYREAGGRLVRLDVYTPAGPAPRSGRPVVVAVHGGGWRGGGKSDFGRSLAVLARSGLVVVAVDYRLSRPGSPSWPENLDDVRAAVEWVGVHAPEFGIDPERLALMGASAGAHLALLAGLDQARAVTVDSFARNSRGRPIKIRALIDFYGPTDLRSLTSAGAASAGLMLGGAPGEVPALYDEAAPLRRVGRESPPVLIVHGSDDLLVPIDQSKALGAALERAGVANAVIVVDGARHGFGLQAGSRDLVPDVLAFLANAWKDGIQTSSRLVQAP